jgi:hypothetical protein
MEPRRLLVGAELSQLNYERISPAASTTYKVLVAPSLGYRVAKNLVVSLGIPLGTSRTSYNFGASSTSNFSYRETQIRIGLSPSIRYYVGESNLKPFVGFSYSYLINRNTYKIIDKYSADDRSNMFIPSIGLAYSLTQKLVLMTSLNYLIDNNESKDLVISGPNTILDTVRPNTKSLSVGLGIQVFLGKK